MRHTRPSVPISLAHRPTTGGLVVPWITPRTGDGRHLLGLIEHELVRQALLRRLCGVCGQPLASERRIVLLMRLSDLPRQRTNEPALHPQCAAYTSTACPMINGSLPRYRSAPPSSLSSLYMPSPDSAARQGAPAEPWFAVWLRDYRVVHEDRHLAASYAGVRPLRIRPITWRHLLLG